MTIPDSDIYKDVHGDIVLPNVTMETLETYLNLVDKSMDNKARNLYKEKFPGMHLATQNLAPTGALLFEMCARDFLIAPTDTYIQK